jgi:N4-gp56 family major capsid protein
MAELINKFNQGELTSSSIDRQFTPEYVTKSVAEMAPRKRYFTQFSNPIAMPKNHGDKITKEVRLPMLHEQNVIDAGLEANTAKILKTVWYTYNADGSLKSTFDSQDYLGANAGDLDAAIAAAKSAAVDDVSESSIEAGIAAGTIRSGAGNIVGGDAAFAVASGSIPELPEEGGVVNLLNSSSKLVTAPVTFHGIGHKYTVRSVELDSRKGQVAQKIKDLSRATHELKEIQVMNAVIAATEANRMCASMTACSIGGMKAPDILTYDALTAFEMELLRNDVPLETTLISGTTKIDTRTVEDGYVALINRELVPTLRKLKGPDGVTLAFKEKSTYAAGTELLDGEVGAVGSFRFVVVPDLQKYAGAGAEAVPYADDEAAQADGYANKAEGDKAVANAHKSGGYYDVFPIIVIGDDSFSTVGFTDKNVTARHIPPVADVYNDMHAQVGGVASSWTFGFLNYRPERLRQLIVTAPKV